MVRPSARTIGHIARPSGERRGTLEPTARPEHARRRFGTIIRTSTGVTT
jgi:hypothetical protein